MNPLYVVQLGSVEDDLLRAIEDSLRRALGIAPVRLPQRPEPRGAFDPARRQFGSIPIMHDLVASCPGDAAKLLGVTGVDLFIPMLSFVYGQAQLQGRIAVLSVARLRQEFYGLPADPEITAGRARKETLHEIGHTFGLTHCLDGACPMALSTTLQQLDRKTTNYCPSCMIMLQENLTMKPTEVRP